MANRKKAVSIRMSQSDIRDVKRLADRLQVRDSDVIRFAVKSALTRLAPLCEERLKGRALVPALLETSSELFRYFDLDLARLECIVNGDGSDAATRVDKEDLRMIAMQGMHRSFGSAPTPASPVTLNGSGSVNGNGSADIQINAMALEQAFRRYLYEKYIASPAGASNGA
jgi:hypothetical protein